MEHNIILSQDLYKASHWLQYPPKTEYVTSYIEARGAVFPFKGDDEVLFLGIDDFIRTYLETPLTGHDVYVAKLRIEGAGLPFNYKGWMSIVEKYEGHLPLCIEALPEGTVTKTGIPLVQVTNTDPEFYWLTSVIETALLRSIWYPTTVGTLSREIKKKIAAQLSATSDDVSGLPFKLHDFGARGVSSSESAAIGGAAHLVNFMGSDTLEAIEHLYNKYNKVYGFSIPASEHSTITTWGRVNEHMAYRNMLDKFGSGLVACVSDSYDLYNAVSNLWGEELKDQIENMDGTLVVRPDSGDPAEVTLKVVEILGEKFGYTRNTKGYRVLPKHIRIIQGDGVNRSSISNILSEFRTNLWSTDNIAFGMGGALLQQVNRDSLKFAMKTNEVVIDGVRKDVYKDPATDPGKASKRGKQIVFHPDVRNPIPLNMRSCTKSEQGERVNLLVEHYNTGQILVEDNFEQIRARAEITI